MNKIYKKITLLCFLFIITSFTSCQTIGCLNSDFEIERRDGEVILVKYKGTGENVKIPKGITIIGKEAFYVPFSEPKRPKFKSVLIPDSVTNIDERAFTLSKDLITIDIPNSVIYIGEEAFKSCISLKNITIPDSVTEIKKATFAGCENLTSIIIPNTVTYIGVASFRNCASLTNVTIPNGVTYLGVNSFGECTSLISITIPKTVINTSYAFGGCTALTSIYVEDGNPNYLSIDGVLFTKDKNTLMQFPPSKEGNTYIIPKGVKIIDEFAFEKCERLTNIIIPNTVTKIGRGAFIKCIGLTSMTIPDSITNIPHVAFADCYNLTSITIPKSVKTVEGNIYMGRAFESCTKLTIYGYKGSYIEKYAKENDIPFKAI